MTHLKLDLHSGISGDMFLGALAPLLDMCADLERLPERMGLPHCTLHFEEVQRSSIHCVHAVIRVKGQAPEAQQQDHDHSHHEHGHSHHEHEQDHHDHDHSHSSHDHSHSSHGHHAHRHYGDILHLIDHADLPDGAKTRAKDMFRMLGEAEAQMHGIPLEQVHFHEVGAEDSILDLCGAAWLIDCLNPEQVYASPVCTGHGSVKTAHGLLPIPAPATLELLKGMPMIEGAIAKEMCTPSGAVILRSLNPHFELPALIPEKQAYGAGSRDLPGQPNALRATLCKRLTDSASSEAISLLQSNLDGCTPEDLGADSLQRLLQAGARDAWISPILMKKGRPAHCLEVLCFPEDADKLSDQILNDYPTLGVRRFDGNRRILPRSQEHIETEFGPLELKVHELPDGRKRRIPEYESLFRLSESSGLSVSELRKRLAPIIPG